MTPRQEFKVGFLKRCAEEGLGPDEAAGRARALVKAALEVSDIPKTITALKETVGAGLGAGIAPLVAAPVVGMAGGGMAGYLAAQMKGRGGDLGTQVDGVHQRELIDAYNLYADRAEEQAAIKRMALQGGPRGMRI